MPSPCCLMLTVKNAVLKNQFDGSGGDLRCSMWKVLLLLLAPFTPLCVGFQPNFACVSFLYSFVGFLVGRFYFMMFKH